ncbi:hypothetical protein V6N13_039007 [Hibiscus sabdariffa]
MSTGTTVQVHCPEGCELLRQFEQDYPVNSPEPQRIEENVESDYYSVLAQNCRFELQQQQWRFIRETPHCDLLQKFPSAA